MVAAFIVAVTLLVYLGVEWAAGMWLLCNGRSAPPP
jgi:hypothetical protein